MGRNSKSAVISLLVVVPALAQTAAPRIPRLPDGKPDLNGFWQTMNTANWDLKAHGPAMAPVVAMGAQAAVPPGIGVVEGDEIPYLPAAVKTREANYANRLALDPETKCYLPGVPRATYMPYPFQILQSPRSLMIAYEYAGAVRNINLGKPHNPPTDTWMGWSNGRWEGDTLVVDVIGFNDQTWFDRAGDFHSDSLHVIERYTPLNADTIQYQAIIEDPKVFSRPWKIGMLLYRHREKNFQLMEFRCAELTEELLYGHLRKKSDATTRPVPARPQ